MKKICIAHWKKTIDVNPWVFGGKFGLAKSLFDGNGDPYLTTEGKQILDKIGTKQACIDLFSNYKYYFIYLNDVQGINFLHNKKCDKCLDLLDERIKILQLIDEDYKKYGQKGLQDWFVDEVYKSLIKSFDKGKCVGISAPTPQNAIYVLKMLWYWAKKHPNYKFMIIE
jgi:hypothetical protein